MKRLNIYLFRQLLLAFLFASVCVTFVILVTQSFRLLSIVINNSATLLIFLQLMMLSIPTFLPIVLPLGLAVGVIFVYYRLGIDSELVVMRAAGLNFYHQAKPALLLALMVMVLCYTLTMWWTPAANRSLVALQYEVRDSYSVFLARPGSFNDITDGLTFYMRSRGKEGELQGILIHDVRNPDMAVTIMADHGVVVDNEGQPQIVIFNGKRQEMDRATGRLSQLAFDRYVLDLDTLRGSGAGHRLPDPREQTLGQLLYPTDEMLRLRTTRSHLMAELHQRLAMPILAPAFTLIGLAGLLAGEFNRRGMGKRILFSAIAVTVVEAAALSLVSIVARMDWLAFALYFVVLAPIPVGLALLNVKRLRRRPIPPAAETVAP